MSKPATNPEETVPKSYPPEFVRARTPDYLGGGQITTNKAEPLTKTSLEERIILIEAQRAVLKSKNDPAADELTLTLRLHLRVFRVRRIVREGDVQQRDVGSAVDENAAARPHAAAAGIDPGATVAALRRHVLDVEVFVGHRARQDEEAAMGIGAVDRVVDSAGTALDRQAAAARQIDYVEIRAQRIGAGQVGRDGDHIGGVGRRGRAANIDGCQRGVQLGFVADGELRGHRNPSAGSACLQAACREVYAPLRWRCPEVF